MRYDVSPDEVRGLATGLRRVQVAVDGLGSGVGSGPASAMTLGDASVARGLLEVARSWSSARRRISAELAGLARAADAAATAYASADGSITAALPGGGTASAAPAVATVPETRSVGR